jgi:hypothetical protein
MTKSEGKGYKRKVLLINPNFQLRFMAFMVGVSLVAISIFYFANHFFFNEFVQQGKDLGLPADHSFFEFIGEQRARMTVIFAVTALIEFFFISLAGLFISHRIAGPLYRLHKYLSDIASGKDVGKVSFRKKDFFPELADATNKALKK